MNTPPPTPSLYTNPSCSLCNKVLVIITNEHLSRHYHANSNTIKLNCNHSFHQPCIIEYAASSPPDRPRQYCPICNSHIFSNRPFLVTNNASNHWAAKMCLRDAIDTVVRRKREKSREKEFLVSMAKMDFGTAELFLRGEVKGEEGWKMDPNVTYEGHLASAMHVAAYDHDVEGVRLLLRYGGDKDLKDDHGKTPLDWARGVDAQDVVNLLQ